MSKKEALSLAGQVDEIYAAKGTKVVHLDLRKSKPADAEILAALLGPTGNLRAPTIRVGKKLIVGFNEDTYSKLL